MSFGAESSYEASIQARSRLSSAAFEISLSRPPDFHFVPGQCIRLFQDQGGRDYSLSSGPAENCLRIVLRLVEGGAASSRLATAPLGQRLRFSGPHGYFLFQASPRQAIFVATGAGVAPFLSMVESGVRDFSLLHGVRSEDELYYRAKLRDSARRYLPCLSQGGGEGCFPGRVTKWARRFLEPGSHDFYLCGSRAMIRDMTLLADEAFPGSRVFTEAFH